MTKSQVDVSILIQFAHDVIDEVDKRRVSMDFVNYRLAVSRDLVLKLLYVGNLDQFFLNPVRGRVQNIMQEIIESFGIIQMVNIIYQI